MKLRLNWQKLKTAIVLGAIANSMVLGWGAIAPSLSQTGSDNNNPTDVDLRYTFRNVQDYTNCIQDILLLSENPEQFRQQGRFNRCIIDVASVYANTGLPECLAFKLIQEADVFATSRLRPPMYPFRGIRLRVAEKFGYSYEVDEADREISTISEQPLSSCQ